MKIDTRIVFIEDVPEEAKRVEDALRKGGMVFELHRVDNEDAFLRVLKHHPPDVILSDHGLPAFDCFAALALARERCPSVPFIFVTNALTKEMEIEKLAAGVADYVPKSHLENLVPAICGALYRTEIRTLPKNVPDNRQQQLAKRILALIDEYESTGGYLPICASCKRIRDRQDNWHAPERFLLEKTGLNFTHGICPECAPNFFDK